VKTVLVDFNDIAEDGLLEAVSDPIDAGTLVFLRDFDGNSCYGTVAGYSDGVLRVVGRWEFWAPAKLNLSYARNQATTVALSPSHFATTRAHWSGTTFPGGGLSSDTSPT
jgi:hypothetical protein